MIVERTCPRCGRTFTQQEPRRAGRPKRWCSLACRRAASEERRAAAGGLLAVKLVRVEASLDEHVTAVLESPAACRRVLRKVGEWDARGRLDSAQWSSVSDELAKLVARRLYAAKYRWAGRSPGDPGPLHVPKM